MIRGLAEEWKKEKEKNEMSDPNNNSIWVIPFNEKKKEFRSLSKKFVAAAVVKKIKPALIGTLMSHISTKLLTLLWIRRR